MEEKECKTKTEGRVIIRCRGVEFGRGVGKGRRNEMKWRGIGGGEIR